MRDYFDILQIAFDKGKEALEKCVPTPQHFYPADLSGKKLDEGTTESEGDCGGAYIRNIQYNSDIYKFFKREGEVDGTGINAKFTLQCKVVMFKEAHNGCASHFETKTIEIILRKDVYKGYTLHFQTNNIYNGQSHERYKAFYDAAAAVLKSEGVSCSVRDYLI